MQLHGSLGQKLPEPSAGVSAGVGNHRCQSRAWSLRQTPRPLRCQIVRGLSLCQVLYFVFTGLSGRSGSHEPGPVFYMFIFCLV